MSATPSRLIDLATAAERFDCSERTVRRMVASGELRGYRVGKRLLRLDLDEVEALPRLLPTAGSAA